MKISVIGDAHFGKYGQYFLESQLRFFHDQAIPYFKKNKIKNLIFTGDIFENRKNLDVFVHNTVYGFFQHLSNSGFTCYLYLGNHDTYYKNTNDVNSLKIFKQIKNVNVIEQIEEHTIGGKDFLFIPWIYDINKFNEEMKSIRRDYDYVFGHFDIIGARMNKWKYSPHGLAKDFIFQFKRVFSGHYHSRSIEQHASGELIYVGTPYQLDRGDVGEKRGFCVIDLETDTYEFVENEKSIKFITLLYPSKEDFSQITGNVVDIVVENEVDTDELATYQEEVNKLKPILPAILKTTSQSYSGIVDVEELNIKSLTDMFDEYVESLGIEDNLKKKVDEELSSLYEESAKEI